MSEYFQPQFWTFYYETDAFVTVKTIIQNISMCHIQFFKLYVIQAKLV